LEKIEKVTSSDRTVDVIRLMATRSIENMVQWEMVVIERCILGVSPAR